MPTLISFASEHTTLTLLLVIVMLLISIVEILRSKRKTLSLSPTDTITAMNHQHAVVLDMRTKEAYQQNHIIDAISISAEELLKDEKKLNKWKTKPLILVSATGMETEKLAATLIKKGYNAKILQGGMRGWVTAGLPLVRSS